MQGISLNNSEFPLNMGQIPHILGKFPQDIGIFTFTRGLGPLVQVNFTIVGALRAPLLRPSKALRALL